MEIAPKLPVESVPPENPISFQQPGIGGNARHFSLFLCPQF
jgi:hypothetical protein